MISEIKNSLGGLNSELEGAQERLCELEDSSIEIM